MTPTETAAILRQFNEWRRGDEDIPQFDPNKIGAAIDAAVEMIDRLEAAESECLEEARLNGRGSEREAALMAKLEAAEKAVTESYQRGYETGQEEIEKERDTLRTNLDDHRALVFDLRKEVEKLRAKLTKMERQKPVATIAGVDEYGPMLTWNKHWLDLAVGADLYALPGAKEQEPTRDWWDCLIADISTIDCMYRGSSAKMRATPAPLLACRSVAVQYETAHAPR